MDENVRSRIVREAAELFHARGYRSVTLDDLAARLGMSKKTLYHYFSGKEQIAEEVLGLTMQAIAESFAEQKTKEGDPIHLLKETLLIAKRHILKLNPQFLEDIQKQIPSLWQRVETFRARQLQLVEELLVKAQNEGYIRTINPQLVAAVMLDNIQRWARPDVAAKWGVAIPDLADTLFTLFFDGLRTGGRQ